MIRGLCGSFDNLYPVVDPPPAWLLDGFSDSNIFLLWCRILYCHRGPFFCEFIPRYYANAKCSVTPFALLSASSTNELLHHFLTQRNNSYSEHECHTICFTFYFVAQAISFFLFSFSLFFFSHNTLKVTPNRVWVYQMNASSHKKAYIGFTEKLTLGSKDLKVS